MVVTNDHLHRITSTRRDRITRASRVRLLAKQVAAGEYHVDVDKLADALIQRAQFHRRVQLELTGQPSPAL